MTFSGFEMMAAKLLTMKRLPKEPEDALAPDDLELTIPDDRDPEPE